MVDTEFGSLVVVGSGLFGLTVARLVVEELELPVTVIDRRDHPGGNAWSSRDAETGIDVHRYGTHVFHTSNDAVWDFVTRFGEWIPYEHRVWTVHAGQLFAMPVNLHTISQFVGRALSPAEAQRLVLEEASRHVDDGRSFESRALASIGDSLYRAFFEGYTRKQWQTSPTDLPADVFSRLPVRFTTDSRYFSDTYQALPREGYGAFVEQLAAHPLITLHLGVDWRDVEESVPTDLPVVYTGAVDEYFRYRHGRLAWRTLDLDLQTLSVGDFQGAPVINYADAEIPYTRVHEFVHLPPHHRRVPDATVIAYEYSRFAEDEDEPFYPIHTDDNRALLGRYRDEAQRDARRIWFGGRLGSYRYLDMHMAIGAAMKVTRSEIVPALQASR